VSLTEQITVLLALAAGLFDVVALEKLPEAERALCGAAAKIPADIAARFTSAQKLSPEDRQCVLEVATTALRPYQTEPEATTSGGDAAAVAKGAEQAGIVHAAGVARGAEQTGGVNTGPVKTGAVHTAATGKVAEKAAEGEGP
jgi:hypothetical protein